ncbi:hypothetical protein [Halorussus salinus]|uniref:hypothetical protein n=1 Tax=Halorussus salinus TaxID=1364935 RepID=UPI00138F0653|nr:hypothetical protein [Halorussus salinus]
MARPRANDGPNTRDAPTATSDAASGTFSGVNAPIAPTSQHWTPRSVRLLNDGQSRFVTAACRRPRSEEFESMTELSGSRDCERRDRPRYGEPPPAVGPRATTRPTHRIL